MRVKLKCKQPHPEFEFCLLRPFPKTITMTPHTSIIDKVKCNPHIPTNICVYYTRERANQFTKSILSTPVLKNYFHMFFNGKVMVVQCNTEESNETKRYIWLVGWYFMVYQPLWVIQCQITHTHTHTYVKTFSYFVGPKGEKKVL